MKAAQPYPHPHNSSTRSSAAPCATLSLPRCAARASPHLGVPCPEHLKRLLVKRRLEPVRPDGVVPRQNPEKRLAEGHGRRRHHCRGIRVAGGGGGVIVGGERGVSVSAVAAAIAAEELAQLLEMSRVLKTGLTTQPAARISTLSRYRWGEERADTAGDTTGGWFVTLRVQRTILKIFCSWPERVTSRECLCTAMHTSGSAAGGEDAPAVRH